MKYILFVVLLLSLLLLVGNCSFAFVNIQNATWVNANNPYNAVETLSKLTTDFLGKDVIDRNNWRFDNDALANSSNAFFTDLNNLNSYDYVMLYIGRFSLSGGYQFYITFSNTAYFNSNSVQYTVKYENSFGKFNVYNTRKTGAFDVTINVNRTGYLMAFYKNGNNWLMPSNSDYVIRQINFESITNNTISIDMNGTSVPFYKLNYGKSVSSWRLGTLSDYSDYNEIQLKLYGYGNINTLENVASIQLNKYGIYSNGLTVDSTGAVYVDSRLLLYNQGYELLVYYYNNNEDNGYLNPFDFYFLPVGDNSSSGDLVNPDNDFNVDFDYDLINSAGAITQPNKDNLSYLLNSTFSGDFSGDLFNNLGFVKPSDTQPHYGIIHQVFNEIIAALFGTYDNVYIDISVHGTNMRLRPSDFHVGQNPITLFVSMFLICGFVFLVYQTITKLYFKFLSLDLSGFLRSTDVDFTIFM